MNVVKSESIKKEGRDSDRSTVYDSQRIETVLRFTFIPGEISSGLGRPSRIKKIPKEIEYMIQDKSLGRVLVSRDLGARTSGPVPSKPVRVTRRLQVP